MHSLPQWCNCCRRNVVTYNMWLYPNNPCLQKKNKTPQNTPKKNPKTAQQCLQHLMHKKKSTILSMFYKTLQYLPKYIQLYLLLVSASHFITLVFWPAYLSLKVLWWEITKTTHSQVNDSLEGVTELSKAVIHSVVVYYSKRIQSKISNKQKFQKAQGGWDQGQAFTCPLQWSDADSAVSQPRCGVCQPAGVLTALEVS